MGRQDGPYGQPTPEGRAKVLWARLHRIPVEEKGLVADNRLAGEGQIGYQGK